MMRRVAKVIIPNGCIYFPREYLAKMGIAISRITKERT